MKTTVELPDPLFRQAKMLAAAQGISLKHFFTEAVEDRLRRSTSEKGAGEKGIGDGAPAWMAGFGALADLAEENRRILETIEAEFERLAPEDLA